MQVVLNLCIIFTFVEFSKQAYYQPQCEAKNAVKKYKDILIVLLVACHEDPLIVQSRRYLLKHIACEVPIADNIQTYILDYSKDDWDIDLKPTDFYDSKKFAETMFDRTDISRGIKDCDRFNAVITKLMNKEAIKNHRNVHFLIEYPAEMNCQLPEMGDRRFSLVVLFLKKEDKIAFSTTGGRGKYDPQQPGVSNEAIVVSKALIESILTEDTGTSSSSLIPAIIGYILAVIFLIIAVIAILKFLKKKKSLKRREDTKYGTRSESSKKTGTAVE